MPPFSLSVALFVDADAATVRAQMRASGCQVAQLHGNESADMVQELRQDFPVIKAFRIRDQAMLDQIAGFPADALLLDAYVPGIEGGTGEAWDYRLLQGRDLGAPVILAGGLTPDNVADAVAGVQPYAVDTASGVESAPGVKSAEAMAAFVVAALVRNPSRLWIDRL